jgi:tetratricopeptide (TPR) repeat protein
LAMKKGLRINAFISAHRRIACLLAATICLGLSPTPFAFAASEQVVTLNNEGVNALKASNYVLATQKFLACLNIDPSYKLARENMAICYNNWGISLQNSPAQAIEKFHKSLFYGPDNVTAAQNLEVTIQNMGKDPHSFKDRVALGKAARLAGDLEGGIVEFSEALKIKDDPALRVELGNLFYVKNRVDDAINQYNISARNPQLDPDTKAKVYRSLGQAYQAKKDYPHSVEAYNVAITLNRTDRETLEANKAVWTEAVQKDPLNAANHVGLGQAYMYIGDFDQAQAELRQALVFDKNNAPARTLLDKIPIARKEFDRDKHINSGVELQTRKLYDAAIEEYKKAFELDQSRELNGQASHEILLNLGSAYQAKEDYNSAISFYQKALQKKPDYTAAADGLKVSQERLKARQLDDAAERGAKEFKSGNFAEALRCYQTLLNANPKDPAAHFNVAATLQRLGQIDPAIGEFRQAVSLAPDNKQYKDYLTKAMQEKADPIIDTAVKKHAEKDYATAIELYQKALAIVPDNSKVLFNLAACYYSRQQFPEAQKIYEQLYQKDKKEYVDDLWFLGTILENAKRGGEALSMYMKYTNEAPGGKYFGPAKERITALQKDPSDTMKIKSDAEIAQDKSADEAYKQGVQAQQEKRYDEAFNLYNKALAIHPKDAAIPFALGTLFQAKQDLDSALKWFQTALEQANADPKFEKKTTEEFKKAIALAKEQKAKPMVDDAVKKQAAGDQQSAITLYKQALEWVPKNARIWTNLGQAYQLLDDFARARDAYQKAVDLDAKQESTDFYLLAKIDEHYGQGSEAVGHYRKYLTAQPTGQYVKDTNERLGALSRDITKTQKLPTQNEIKTAKLADEEYTTGLASQKAGNAQEALGHYQKAAAAKPDESAYVEAIATCYQQLKDYDNALSAYDQAIALAAKAKHQKDVDIYKGQRDQCAEEKGRPIVDKALAAFKSGDFAAAAELYGQATQILPGNSHMHTSRAAALQASDNFQGALDEYQKAYDLDPKAERENLYFIGALQEHFGRGQKALDIYRKYLNENPAGQYLTQSRQRAAALSTNITATVKIPTSGERKSQEEIGGHYNAAIDGYNKKDYQKCVAEMQIVLGILASSKENKAPYLYQLGLGYLGSNQFDDARAQFTQALQIDPKNKQYKDALNSCLALQLSPIVDDAVKKQTAGDLPGAIAGYKQALQLDPNNAGIHINLGSALNSTEDWAGARAEFDKGLSLDRKAQIGALYFIGLIDENFGKGQLALQEYKQYVAEAGPSGAYYGLAQGRIKTLSANPNDTQKFTTQAEAQKTAEANQAYQDGYAAQQAKKFDEAIQKYSHAVELCPREPAYVYALGTAQDNNGDLEAAIKTYEKAIGMNPKEKSWKDAQASAKQRLVAPLLQSAYQKQTTKDDKGMFDLPGAIVDYEKAVQLNEDGNTRLNLGTAYQGNFDQTKSPANLNKALENYKRAVQLDQNLADAYYYMATVYEALMQPQLALPEYKRYLAKAPTGPNAAACKERVTALGGGTSKPGQPPPKVVTAEEAQKAAAAAQAYQDGYAAQQAGKFDEAIQKYSEAVAATPAEASFHFALGTAYDNKGDLDNAIKTYEKALTLNNKDKTWKDALKSAKQRKAAPIVEKAFNQQAPKDGSKPDLPGAIQSYEAALKIDDDATTHLNLGLAYQGMTPPNLLKALDHYKKALAMDANQVDGYYYMGTVYENLNKAPQAIQAYRTYLQKQPAGPNAGACKERLKILKAM